MPHAIAFDYDNFNDSTISNNNRGWNGLKEFFILVVFFSNIYICSHLVFDLLFSCTLNCIIFWCYYLVSEWVSECVCVFASIIIFFYFFDFKWEQSKSSLRKLKLKMQINKLEGFEVRANKFFVFFLTNFIIIVV